MEAIKNEIGEAGLPVPETSQEEAALDVIRTETVLSRLPIHNLAKRGNVNIQILKTTPDGKVDLKWIVSYSDRYGQARQLAYKLDTIVINHHIDEQGRPLPKMICLGSLRDVADQLDLGGDTNKVRRALRQNASAFITAKFEYKGNDGTKKTLEADFTRYSVVFTGEQLPDGRRADAVYIILNEPYREVLNNAPVRPLDRAYMKALPPAAQRFYEIISYKIFSAIKNNYPNANISYSEYCTFSAQLRHFERQPVQDQMAKVIRHHKKSGYITAVKYESAIDAENKPDWIMYLTPGPKAFAEFAIAHGRKPRKAIDAGAPETAERQPKRHRTESRQQRSQFQPTPSQPMFDPQLVAEFTRRGIAEKKAAELLANVKPGQDVVAQLEMTDQLIEHSRIQITNPPGFYIRLIESNTPIPEGFETKAKRKSREETERKQQVLRATEEARQELKWEYDDYCSAETDRFIAENPATFETVKEAKRVENRERHQSFSPDMIESVAAHDAKREIRKQMSVLTFEEFVDRKQQGTNFSLKPVGPSPAPDPAPSADASVDRLAADEAREAEINNAEESGEKATADSALQSVLERGVIGPEMEASVAEAEPQDATRDATPAVPPGSTPSDPVEKTTQIGEPDAKAALMEPLMIELISDPPQDELGGAMAGEQAA